ncbi:hypothetical protein CONLIGDRAFT_682263 [Coniochaeta ligniaria NRRL 30616]|uniref:Uncharacterized protein n=1 Tax=Coniochaeta ligniaria NRRL 30616 TaxID=1408157 RepID=A0A1J7JD75_9PEZI|nr:hypothetical protein CONLIGDRAFT_682263 [Coniochaeta ligniaria NRRL 30616]
MSGSGGYNKYRCKYFSTHGCEHWVLVKNAACLYCVAAGRDDVGMPAEQLFNHPQEVCIPIVHQGTLSYTIIMELVQTGQSRNHGPLRHKATQQPLMPTITTSDTPGIVLPTAGMGTHTLYQN